MNRIAIKLFILFLFFETCNTALYAQPPIETKIKITGSVMDERAEPIPYANVVLLRESKKVGGVTTDDNGRFSLPIPKAASYTLSVSYIGFLTQNVEVTIPKGEHAEKQYNIVLNENPTLLGEVTIQGTPPAISREKEKTVANVSQAVSAGMSALDMLKRLPGITVDGEGTLSLRGKKNINVLIDGVSTWLAPEQLAQMLEGLPAGDMEKVEIYAASPTHLDAGGTGGAINIITKKRKSEGYAIDLTGSAGMSRRNEFFNGNMSGSYVTPRLNLFAMFDASNKHRRMEQESQSMIAENGEPFIYRRNTDRPIMIDFYTYRLGAIWKISKRSTTELVWNGYYDDWRLADSRSIGQAFHPVSGKRKYSQETISTAKEPYTYNTVHAKLTHLIDTMGKQIAFDGDYALFGNGSDGRVTVTRTHENDAPKPIVDFRYKQPLSIHIGSLKSDAELPFPLFSLKAGAKYATMHVKNPVDRWDRNNLGEWVPTPQAEDDYRYNETIVAGYLSLGKKWEHFEVDAGVRIEHTASTRTSKGIKQKQNYTDFFPQIQLAMSATDKQRIELSLSRRINRPSYIDLSVVRWYYDAAFETSGNPLLKPEYSLTSALTYTLNGKYTLGIDYTFLKDAVQKSMRQDAQGKTQWIFENFRRADILHAHAFAPISIGSQWKLQASAEAFYIRQPLPASTPSGEKMHQNLHTVLSLNQQVDLPGKVRLDLSSRYISKHLSAIRLIDPEFTFDAGIKRSFGNGKLTLSLTATDIFATLKEKYRSATDLIQYRHTSRTDSRRVFLSLKYHIGGTLKVIDEHKTEEKKRL